MAELFGFQITRANQKAKAGGTPQSFTVPTADDGTTTVSAGGYFGSYLDQEGGAKNEEELIRRYREIAIYPEVDTAIDDIVNEAIVADERDQSVSLSLDNLNLSHKDNLLTIFKSNSLISALPKLFSLIHLLFSISCFQ